MRLVGDTKLLKTGILLLKKHFTELDMVKFCNVNPPVFNKNSFINLLMSKMFDKYVDEWKDCINAGASRRGTGRNKLRTYCIF